MALHDLINAYNQTIQMPGGWTFNQSYTLKYIYHYINSKYTSGDLDEHGRLKLFRQIILPAAETATKLIDIDTGDIMIVPKKESEEFKVWVINRKFRQWMTNSDFAEFLNELAELFPLIGHVVFRLNGSHPENVPIYNFRINPAARSINAAREFAYAQVMTLDEIKENPLNDEESIKLLESRNAREFLVYDYWEKLPTGKWKLQVIADPFSTFGKNGTYNHTLDEPTEPSIEITKPIVLRTEEWKHHGFYEVRWRRVQGRWLGLGYAEYLIDEQIAINEISYYERRALRRRATRRYQTANDEIGGKDLEKYPDGAIIQTTDPINIIPEDPSEIAAFNATTAHWLKSVTSKTFTTDILQGENMPSRTPFGVAALQTRLATSYFEQKREQLALALKSFITREVIPSFAAQPMGKEDILIFASTDEEIEMFDTAVTQMFVDKFVSDYAKKTGFYPPSEAIETYRENVKNNLRRKNNRYVKIPSDFYRNFIYNSEIVITGESVNTSRLDNVYQFILNLVNSNPQVVPNGPEVVRAILRQIFINHRVPPSVMASLFTQGSQDKQLQEVAQQPARGGTLPPLQPQQVELPPNI